MPISEALVQLWPPLLLLAALLGALELALRKTRLLAAFESSLRGRIASIDGLRAFLAYGVVACHVGTYFYYYRSVPWGPHPNPYYRQAGAASVRLFFMITGYLFWSKAIAGGGRLDAARLYRNRLYRIMPLYGALVLTLAALAAANASFRLVEPPGRVATEFAGLLVPGLDAGYHLDGFDYGEFVRQAWTLKWEIVFYALLPLIAFGARSLAAFASLAVALLALTALAGRHVANLDPSIALGFVVGMAVAHLKARWPSWPFAESRLASALILGIAALAPLVIERVSPYAGNLLYAATFVLVVYGTDAFGLLTARSARVLGEISYSVYLLHLLVLAPFVRLLNARTPIPSLSHEAYWLASALPVSGIVLLSLATFRTVERWGIARSHRRPATSP